MNVTTSKPIYKLNIVKSPTDERDIIYKNYDNVPEEFDMRPYLQPIRDQGEQGSCFAMSASCMKEYQEKKEYNFDEYFSPQFFYDNRTNFYDDDKNNDEGMYGRDVMRLLKNIGICTEKEYPYGKIKDRKDISEEIYKSAKNHVIKSYARIDTIVDLKNSLFFNGPCLICFPIYNYGKYMWIKEENNPTFDGGHAMVVVGYDKKGFIIRNSWGKNWGDKGYCHYPYSQFGKHWEIWTTVDAINEIEIDTKPKLEFFPTIENMDENKCKMGGIIGLIALIVVCIILI